MIEEIAGHSAAASRTQSRNTPRSCSSCPLPDPFRVCENTHAEHGAFLPHGLQQSGWRLAVQNCFNRRRNRKDVGGPAATQPEPPPRPKRRKPGAARTLSRHVCFRRTGDCGRTPGGTVPREKKVRFPLERSACGFWKRSDTPQPPRPVPAFVWAGSWRPTAQGSKFRNGFGAWTGLAGPARACRGPFWRNKCLSRPAVIAIQFAKPDGGPA